MRFIVNSQVLLKQLQSISGVITSNNTIPIINCFHFHLDEGLLTIKATDLETTMIVRLEVETGPISGINEVAVPSRLILDILKNMDDVPVTFVVDDETYAIDITSGEGKYHLAGTAADAYPQLAPKGETNRVEMPSMMLVNAINKTAFAASADEMRQQMSGIYCEMSPDGFTFVATDAHKLVRYIRRDVVSEESTDFILPRKPITLVKNILSSLKEDVKLTIEYSTSNAYFSFGDFNIICRLVDGKYPNYEAAIPKENPNLLTVDRVSFLNTLRRVGLFASQSTHQVRLSLTATSMNISAEDLEFANKAQEQMACEYNGDPMEIGFNAKFLTEMVSNLDSENVMMELSHPSRAGILYPMASEEEKAKEDILMLVMPVMLAN